MLDDEARSNLIAAIASDGEIRFDEAMARHTTLRIGGPADGYALPKTYEALARVRRVCRERGILSRAFGQGTNLLVRDGGIRGVAISLRHLARVQKCEDQPEAGATDLWIEAGAATGKVLAFATINELGGVEFLGGVPGTVGGGLTMNAGTTLGEFKDVTLRVFSIDENGDTLIRENGECGFGYRRSTLPPSEVVTHARLRLTPRPRRDIDQAVRQLRDRRKAREPHGVPNAGSIFKNPPGDYAGRLIEACGLKGRRVGGAEVSPVHANWIVNAEKATAKDLLALGEIVKSEVVKRFGIELEYEIKIVGEER